MRKSFLIGAAVGAAVFVQGLLMFRLPIRVPALQMWALACGGMFGLTLGSTFRNATQAAESLTFAAIGLVLFYGLAALALRAAYRAWKWAGVVLVTAVIVAVHGTLYLALVRSVVA